MLPPYSPCQSAARLRLPALWSQISSFRPFRLGLRSVYTAYGALSLRHVILTSPFSCVCIVFHVYGIDRSHFGVCQAAGSCTVFCKFLSTSESCSSSAVIQTSNQLLSSFLPVFHRFPSVFLLPQQLSSFSGLSRPFTWLILPLHRSKLIALLFSTPGYSKKGF